MATEQVEQQVTRVLEKMNELISAQNQVCAGYAIFRELLMDLDMRVSAMETVVGTQHDARLTDLRVRLEAIEDLMILLQIAL